MHTLLLMAALAQPDIAIDRVAPEIVTAKVEKDDVLVSRSEVELDVPVRVKKKTVVGGKEVIVEEIGVQKVKQTRERRWRLQGATVSTAGGRKVELAELRKLLATPRPVVVASDGRMPAAPYLKVLAPNTIVIAARENAPPPPGTPAVPPPPRILPVEKP